MKKVIRDAIGDTREEFSRAVSFELWGIEIASPGVVGAAATEVLRDLPDLTPLLGLSPRQAALRLVENQMFG